MSFPRKFILCMLLLCSSFSIITAQSWRGNMENLIYTPRFFGPNAFPLTELGQGEVGKSWEAEVRGTHHFYIGDATNDLYLRLFIPIVRGRAGFEVCGVAHERYEMSLDTRNERHAAGTTWEKGASGDFIIKNFYQLLRSDKWCNMVVSANLKTASGNRLADARYTDAAAYWFDITIGRKLLQNRQRTAAVSLQAMAGFYCWMTNDMIHRQNDALLYGVGISGYYKKLSLASDLSGFSGYKLNGDQPLTFRSKLNFEFKKNILSFRYSHGIRDNLYDSYSVGYIRCF